MSDSLRPHGLQHSRLPCPSLSPRVCSSSYPLSRWCYLTISSSVASFSSCPSIFPSIRVFSNESAPHIRWPKYWSFRFSISPSDEYSGLISFRTDWFDLLAVQRTLKRVFCSITIWKHQFSVLSILYSLVLMPMSSNQSFLKEINPEYWLEGLMLKLKLQ